MRSCIASAGTFRSSAASATSSATTTGPPCWRVGGWRAIRSTSGSLSCANASRWRPRDMALARGFEPKTDLTPHEKIKVAYFHLLRGIAQHTLADMFDVNGGRVAEAVGAVRKAVGLEDEP